MRMRNRVRLRRAGELGVADTRPLVLVPIRTGCRRTTNEPTQLSDRVLAAAWRTWVHAAPTRG
jgi:hypothetical protein